MRLRRRVTVRPSPGVECRRGSAMSPDEWARHKGDWLPSPKDNEYLKSIQAKPVYEPGKFANYIAPPIRGINRMPINYEYVRTEA